MAIVLVLRLLQAYQTLPLELRSKMVALLVGQAAALVPQPVGSRPGEPSGPGELVGAQSGGLDIVEMTERYDWVEVRERRQGVGQVIDLANLATKVGG